MLDGCGNSTLGKFLFNIIIRNCTLPKKKRYFAFRCWTGPLATEEYGSSLVTDHLHHWHIHSSNFCLVRSSYGSEYISALRLGLKSPFSQRSVPFCFFFLLEVPTVHEDVLAIQRARGNGLPRSAEGWVGLSTARLKRPPDRQCTSAYFTRCGQLTTPTFRPRSANLAFSMALGGKWKKPTPGGVHDAGAPEQCMMT